MKERAWTTFVDIITVVWLLLLVCGAIAKNESVKDGCALAVLCLLPIFICDLIFLCRKEENFKTFIKKKWFDVLLVIPYFRIFRILRIFRFTRFIKVMKVLRVKKALGVTRFTKKSKRVVKSVAVNRFH